MQTVKQIQKNPKFSLPTTRSKFEWLIFPALEYAPTELLKFCNQYYGTHDERVKIEQLMRIVRDRAFEKEGIDKAHANKDFELMGVKP